MDNTSNSTKAPINEPEQTPFQGFMEDGIPEIGADSFVSQEATIKTDIDDLLKLISQKREISVSDAAKALGVPQQTVDAWSIFLEEDGVIDVKYKLTTPYLVAKDLRKAQSTIQNKSDQKDLDTKGSVLLRKPGQKPLQPLVDDNLSVPQFFKDATKDVDSLFNSAYGLIQEGKFEEANRIYEQIKQENERLPNELKEFKKDITLNLSKLNKDLIIHIEKYNLKTTNELSKYIEKKLPRLSREIDLGNIKEAQDTYADIQSAFATFPAGFESRKADLQARVIETYRKLLAKKKALLIRYNSTKSQQIRKLTDDIRLALNSGQIDQAVKKYDEAKQLYSELPEGFAEENEALTRDLFSLVPEIISSKKKHSSDEFTSIASRLRTLIDQTYDSMKQGKIEAAERSYSELKELHSHLPKDFFNKMVDLESEILELEHKLLLLSKNSSLMELKQLSASISALSKSAKDYIRHNNVELAEGIYYELLSKYRQIPEGFLEQKTVLGVEVLNIFREILLKYDEDLLKGLNENTNASYKKIIQLLTTLRGDIEEEKLEAIEHKFEEITEIFGQLPFRFVQENTKLWKEIQLLSSEIELFKKAQLLPNYKDNPSPMNTLLGEIRVGYLQISRQFQDFPDYSKLLSVVKNNYLFYYNLVNRTNLTEIPPDQTIQELSIPPKISIGSNFPQDRMPTPQSREDSPFIPPADFYPRQARPAAPQNAPEIETLNVVPSIDMPSVISDQLDMGRVESQIQASPFEQRALEPLPQPPSPQVTPVIIEDVVGEPLPRKTYVQAPENSIIFHTQESSSKNTPLVAQASEPNSARKVVFISDYLPKAESSEKAEDKSSNLAPTKQASLYQAQELSQRKSRSYIVPKTADAEHAAAATDTASTKPAPKKTTSHIYTNSRPTTTTTTNTNNKNPANPKVVVSSRPEPMPGEITPDRLRENLITNLLSSANNRMKIGRLDDAENTYKQVLSFDGFNSEARAKLKEIENRRAEQSSATLRITEMAGPQISTPTEKRGWDASNQSSPKIEHITSITTKLESFDKLINSELSKDSAKKSRANRSARKSRPGKKSR